MPSQSLAGQESSIWQFLSGGCLAPANKRVSKLLRQLDSSDRRLVREPRVAFHVFSAFVEPTGFTPVSFLTRPPGTVVSHLWRNLVPVGPAPEPFGYHSATTTAATASAATTATTAAIATSTTSAAVATGTASEATTPAAAICCGCYYSSCCYDEYCTSTASTTLTAITTPAAIG